MASKVSPIVIFTFLFVQSGAHFSEKESSKGNQTALNALPHPSKVKRDTTDFPVCPRSSPIAFNSGRHCCLTDEVFLKDSSSTCPGNTITRCPSNNGRCESWWTPCTSSILVEDFDNEEYNGVYYTHEDLLIHNRPVYVKNDKQCLWWHRQFRHWWMGACEHIGDNQGYAWLVQDLSCPTVPQEKVIWRRGGNNAIIHGNITPYNRGIVGKDAPAQSATAGSGARVFRGRYRQLCRWTFSNGRFRCIKRT